MKKQYALMFALFWGLSATVSSTAAESTQIKEKRELKKSAIEIPSPKIWLESTSKSLLDEMDLNLTKYQHDQQALEQFLFNKALKFWDTHLMSKGLAGKFWYKSGPELRKKLELSWKWTMVRYFVTAFEFYDGQRLHLEDRVNCSTRSRCWVKTIIPVVGKGEIDIDFYLHLTKVHNLGANQLQWHLIDIRVAGISIIKHKKGETRRMLHEQGIAGLISALNKKNNKKLIMKLAE